MKNVYMGNDADGKRVELDFDKEGINFILLVGETGSGKSFFHAHLYKELMEKYSSDEIGFAIFDMTRVGFMDFPSDYLVMPIIHDATEAIKALKELADSETDKLIFIHIEECDMVYRDRKAVEDNLRKMKERKNFHIIYSTSRLDRGYLDAWMKKFIDLKVVFAVSNEDDSSFLLGNKRANHFNKIGEKVLAFNNQQIVCRPFQK